jgi:hypothetical protein
VSKEEMVADKIVSAYLRDRVTVARLCDEQLDRSGALLGYVRELALARTHAASMREGK